MELKLEQLGAGREVGRSCIGLTFPDKTRLLLDGGSKFVPGGVLYSLTPKDIKEVKAVIVSHSHADHVCGLPNLVRQGLDCPVISNRLTMEASKVLLWDSYEIDKRRYNENGNSAHYPFYGRGCVVRVVEHLMEASSYGKIGGVKYTLIPSGHIPGSSSVLLEYEGVRIIYSSDINYNNTLLLKGSGRLPLADILIIDSTYGYREHDNRKQTLENFKQKVLEVTGRGGSILVGVFGVARAQEVMIFLDQLDLDIPIYLDGMARAITDIYLDHPEYVNAEELASANRRVRRIDGKDDRFAAIEAGQAIYLATSGMFGGGPVLEFLQALAHDPKSAVIITGYQPSGSGGSQLLNDKRIKIRQPDGSHKTIFVEGDIVKYGLSAHSDIGGLGEVMTHVDPSYVVAQHGNSEAVDAVVDFAKAQNRIAHGPKNGDELIFNI